MSFSTLKDLRKVLIADLNSTQTKKSISILYSLNGTGKTRLSVEFAELNNEDEAGALKVLTYNAFLEDLFTWNNDEYSLNFASSSWVAKLIRDEGFEKEISDTFKAITNLSTEPLFNFATGQIFFTIASEAGEGRDYIKISRGEESVFMWSIFLVILRTAIEALNTNKDDRTTELFNDLEYVVIDDPVSSIDDSRIITVAIGLVETIKESSNPNLNFLVTTHHALFYNVLQNTINRLAKSACQKSFYTLSKDSEGALKLDELASDSPFAYHLLVKDTISNAIANQGIEKYHFNLFRGLLEKTANFLGYPNSADCVRSENRDEFWRIINLYSHNKLSDLESSQVNDRDKQLFSTTFTSFIEDYKYNS